MNSEPYVAAPSEGRTAPGVLVLHAWWGLNDTFRGVCDRLAAEGFVALAPDIYGDGVIATTVEDAEAHMRAASDSAMRERVEWALDALLAHPAVVGRSVGVIGFSLGAAFALWLSRRRPEVGAVVTFYGTDGGSGDYAPSHAAYLGHYAPGDEWEPDEAVTATEEVIRAGGRSVAIHRYAGTRHWFFELDRPEFDPDVADLAWKRTIAFLRENLGPRGA
ncbi:MAG TPA: dienelactone hydrolase family protein [Chthonomonadaceae bacterium]|nr:dienelactone hydrolase family protein [Chthonomonadaceae bacterium]